MQKHNQPLGQVLVKSKSTWAKLIAEMLYLANLKMLKINTEEKEN
jgi:hypothetical protein